jgi:hypothetical protein
MCLKCATTWLHGDLEQLTALEKLVTGPEPAFGIHSAEGGPAGQEILKGLKLD